MLSTWVWPFVSLRDYLKFVSDPYSAPHQKNELDAVQNVK
jgi:hypothetical protein